MIVEKCPHCGAKMKKYWHSLTPILVESLQKMQKHIKATGVNEVHLQRDLDLTKNEYNNFQKLRFHGLTAKVENSDGIHKAGYWLLTKRGTDFLDNQFEVPRRVQTFRNKVVAHDPELVTVRNVAFVDPYMQTKEDFSVQKRIDGRLSQAEMFSEPAFPSN